jgi:hypothetical protein
MGAIGEALQGTQANNLNTLKGTMGSHVSRHAGEGGVGLK